MNFLQMLNETCKNYPELMSVIAIGFLVSVGKFFWGGSSESQTVIHNHIHLPETPDNTSDENTAKSPVVNVNVTQNNKNTNTTKEEKPSVKRREEKRHNSSVSSKYDENGNKAKETSFPRDWFTDLRNELEESVRAKSEEETVESKPFKSLSPGVHWIQGYIFWSNDSYVRIAEGDSPPVVTWPKHSCFHFTDDTLNPCDIDLGDVDYKDEPLAVKARVLVEEKICDWRVKQRPNESPYKLKFTLLSIYKN